MGESEGASAPGWGIWEARVDEETVNSENTSVDN